MGASRLLTPDQECNVVSRYLAGEGSWRLASHYGTHPPTILNILRRAGIPIRGNPPSPQPGDTQITTQGYVHEIVGPDDPHVGMAVFLHGRKHTLGVLQHRLVMARQLGRDLLPSEQVHHIDGDTQNNHPKNLQLRRGAHGAMTAIGCLDCGSHHIGRVPI